MLVTRHLYIETEVALKATVQRKSDLYAFLFCDYILPLKATSKDLWWDEVHNSYLLDLTSDLQKQYRIGIQWHLLYKTAPHSAWVDTILQRYQNRFCVKRFITTCCNTCCMFWKQINYTVISKLHRVYPWSIHERFRNTYHVRKRF